MNRPLLSAWAKDFPGTAETKTLREGIQAVHDLLLIAARHQADVSIVCGSLRHSFRDELWQEVTGLTYADCLDAVISQGGVVRIVLANTFEADEPMSAGLIRLRGQYGRGAKSPLIIRATDREHLTGFPHFVVANARADAGFWLLRVEGQHDLVDGEDSLDTMVEGEMAGGANHYARIGQIFLTKFNELFEQVGQNASAYSVLA